MSCLYGRQGRTNTTYHIGLLVAYADTTETEADFIGRVMTDAKLKCPSSALMKPGDSMWKSIVTSMKDHNNTHIKEIVLRSNQKVVASLADVEPDDVSNDILMDLHGMKNIGNYPVR